MTRRATDPRRRALVVTLAGAAAAGVAYALSRLRGGRRDARGSAGAGEYVCACGAAFRVAGGGRHRVYWLAGAPETDPVLGHACPTCARPLPHDEPIAAA